MKIYTSLTWFLRHLSQRVSDKEKKQALPRWLQHLHRNTFGRNSKTLFFTSLKILSSPAVSAAVGTTHESSPQISQHERLTDDAGNDVKSNDARNRRRKPSRVDSLDVSLLHVPRHPPGVEIRPFHMTSQSLVPDISSPEDKKRVGSLRDLHLVSTLWNFDSLSLTKGPNELELLPLASLSCLRLISYNFFRRKLLVLS